MKIIFFNDEIYEFLISQDDILVAKINRVLDLLEKYGNELRFPHTKKVAKEIFELRILGHQSLRILFSFSNFSKQEAIILHTFFKKSQKIPKGEINIAKRRLLFFMK